MTTWDGVLKVLRDPLVALGLSLVLAVLASRVGGCVVRLVLGIGSAAAFVWLLVRFEPFQDFVVAVVSTIGTIFVVLLVLVAVVALTAFLTINAMHRRAEAEPVDRVGGTLAPVPRRHGEPSPVDAAARLTVWLNDFARLEARLLAIVEPVLRHLENEDSVSKVVGDITRAYFSGLSSWMPEVRRIEEEGTALLHGMADELPPLFSGVSGRRLHALASAKSYLPAKGDWDDLTDGAPWYSYWLVRGLCLHRDWRTAGTALWKCHYGRNLLTECLEIL
ncbi:hypothetical protein ACFFQW_16095 [Umezawaea endophytica]|uniref:Uncharacterized protein n=1 Tax=Umezawaea endophytica TaxID=1654476 RepID=A0A9X3A4U3_9PSEU|nr:hypothetical protein [Umezawaea endophytica]MCS7481618.1 hypothetical protein [Umezawaea endophytica]